LFRKYSVGPSQIVHYTSVETLSSILKYGNLRMTHFQHLNDSTEMLHGRKVVNELLEAETKGDNPAAQFFDFCKFHFTEIDDDAIQYFVSSFSVLSDDANLWARYGVRGRGVALMFATRRMGATAQESSPYF